MPKRAGRKRLQRHLQHLAGKSGGVRGLNWLLEQEEKENAIDAHTRVPAKEEPPRREISVNTPALPELLQKIPSKPLVISDIVLARRVNIVSPEPYIPTPVVTPRTPATPYVPTGPPTILRQLVASRDASGAPDIRPLRTSQPARLITPRPRTGQRGPLIPLTISEVDFEAYANAPKRRNPRDPRRSVGRLLSAKENFPRSLDVDSPPSSP